MKKWAIGFAILLTLGLTQTKCLAKEALPTDLANVGIQEKIGITVSKNIQFTNEQGQKVTLGQYITKDKATILNIVYFNCPMLCNMVLTGLVDGLSKLPTYPVGKGYQIITISMNPNDTYTDAANFKEKYISKLKQPNAAKDWHYLVGTKEEIEKLAKQIGFKYAYNPNTKEYAHAAVQTLLTPSGKVSRYLYGIEYKPLDLRLGIIEAKQGVLTNSIERLLLFCYNYDTHARGYALYAINLMKLAGFLTIIALGGMIYWLTKKYKIKDEESRENSNGQN